MGAFPVEVLPVVGEVEEVAAVAEVAAEVAEADPATGLGTVQGQAVITEAEDLDSTVVVVLVGDHRKAVTVHATIDVWALAPMGLTVAEIGATAGVAAVVAIAEVVAAEVTTVGAVLVGEAPVVVEALPTAVPEDMVLEPVMVTTTRAIVAVAAVCPAMVKKPTSASKTGYIVEF